MRSSWSVLVTVAMLTLLTTSGRSQWILEYEYMSAAPASKMTSYCGLELSEASARALPSSIYGFGHAFDDTLMCSGQAAAAHEVVQVGQSRYVGVERPTIEVTVHAQMQGEVDLLNAPCGAAAVGFASYTSNLSASGVVARLTESAAQTDGVQIGAINLNLPGMGASIAVRSGVGEGVYPDFALDSGYYETCGVGVYGYRLRGRAYVKVMANGGWFTFDVAECCARIFANASYVAHFAYLAQVPICP